MNSSLFYWNDVSDTERRKPRSYNEDQDNVIGNFIN